MPGEVFGCQRRNFNPAWSSGCSSSVPAASPGCTDWMFWRFTTFPAPRGLQTFALYLCSFYFFILYLFIYFPASCSQSQKQDVILPNIWVLSPSLPAAVPTNFCSRGAGASRGTQGPGRCVAAMETAWN